LQPFEDNVYIIFCRGEPIEESAGDFEEVRRDHPPLEEKQVEYLRATRESCLPCGSKNNVDDNLRQIDEQRNFSSARFPTFLQMVL
jgi:hypothetical protein